ncbi:MAG: nucleoside-diphosphate kinase [Candidatus Omnitrophica bacterium]|nr:nucleoside-diphosphate kinase [Candidatus Omnitrophota bacterium]
MEKVLVLIKPDGMQKVIVGNVLNLFLVNDVKLIAMKLVKPSTRLAQNHYQDLKGKTFFKEIVEYLEGRFHDDAPVVAMVFEGRNIVKRCRDIAGATNPEEASPRSVRGKYGRITTKGLYENVVHVSSSNEEARREIALWFKKNELIPKESK